MESEVTRDRFLGGRLTLTQPKHGYRAGTDAVLLAAAVPARPGQSALDLGCGAGAAGLCLQTRVGDLALCGLELQPAYADLARINAAKNGLAFEVIEGDLRRIPECLRSKSFDHVILNPPYYRSGHRTACGDPGRETALSEAVPLALWIDVALRRLAPGGYLTIVQKAVRLPDLMAAIDSRIGTLRVLPVAPRAGRAAELVLFQARKGGRGAFRLSAPFILHRGARHVADGEDYSDAAQQVLRHAAPLALG